MNKSCKYILYISLLAVFLLGGQSIFAADTTPQAADKTAGAIKGATEKVKAKRGWYPFGGIVVAMDRQANTLSLKRKVGARILRLDALSMLEINGKPVGLGSVKVGDYVHGKLHKDSAGSEVITSAKFEKEAPKKETKGAIPGTPR